MVLVPVLLYPLIIIGMSLAFSVMMQSQEETKHIISFPAAYTKVAEKLEQLYTEHEEEFGAFHMSLVKLIPTALLGAAFAYIVAKSKSLYVASLLHCLNNAVSMMILKYPEQSVKIVPILAKKAFSASDLIILTAVGIACAFWGFRLLDRGREVRADRKKEAA